MRARLLVLPAAVQRMLAWTVVLAAPALFVLVMMSVTWTGLQTQQRLGSLHVERDQLAGRVEAQLADLAARSAAASSAVSAASTPEETRAQFQAEYQGFLEALEVAGIDIAQATGIGETDLGDGLGELSAAWAASAPLDALLDVLGDAEMRGLSISEFSINATPNPGRVDVFIEFRRAFVREELEG